MSFTSLATIPTLFAKYGVAKNVLDKISIWKGDITKLEIDCIVNAANKELRGGGGVDFAIHRAAGIRELQEECREIGSCDVGKAVTTSGCNIEHIKNIIHAVGPQVPRELEQEHEDQLKSCYKSSLEEAIKNDLRSIAFCCISTGIYGYPNGDAAQAVGSFLINWLKSRSNREKIDRIVLCVFLEVDEWSYNKYFESYAIHVYNKRKERREAARAAFKDAAIAEAEETESASTQGSSREPDDTNEVTLPKADVEVGSNRQPSSLPETAAEAKLPEDDRH